MGGWQKTVGSQSDFHQFYFEKIERNWEKMNLILHDQFFLNQKKTVGVLWTPTKVETATNFPIGAFPNVR